MVPFKNKIVLLGGVSDKEKGEDKIDSKCFDEMFCYIPETNKWFPMVVSSLKNEKAPESQPDDATVWIVEF